jgi:perosamine synthetase
MNVPQLEPWIGKAEYDSLSDCFTEKWITEGPKAKEFVEKILKLCGSKYGVLAPNGTLALYLGLRAINIGPGDEVLVPDFTFMASATAVEMTGATPVFVEVNRNNFQIEVSNLQKSLTLKTKAIMPVHIYGTIANMDEVMDFSKKHKLKVIEDAAEAIDVYWKGKHAGTFGDVGCFSFFADKTITTGEGGMIVTDNENIYKKLLFLRNQGRIDRGSFIHPEIGYNFRMTDIQCAIGLAQLEKLPEIKKRKIRNKNLYMSLLKGIPEISFFDPYPDATFLPFRVGILYKYASELRDYLQTKGIQPRTFFYPLHKQPCFANLAKKYKYKDVDFENSIYGFENGICLPVYPTLTEEQINFVCENIKSFIFKKNSIFYDYYDLIMKDKDYKGEVDFVFNLVNSFGTKPLKVLEIGSGTGNHTINISEKVREVIAVDIDQHMVEEATKKVKKLKIKNVKFINSSVHAVTDNDFDMALAMFNVITYIDKYIDLKDLFLEVYKRLKKNGILFFDAWNGLAVINDSPKIKINNFKLDSGEHLKLTIIPTTDYIKQQTELNYKFEIDNNKQIGDFIITQTFWTPKQIESAANEAGFTILKSFPFMKPDEILGIKDWKAMYLLKKK